MIDLAVVGAGRWGPNLIRNFCGFDDVRLRAVIDTDQQALDSMASLFSDVELHSNFDSIFSLQNLQAVVIATPAPTHFELTKQCLQSGLHVMVEKPLCFDLDEIRQLHQLALDQQRILMVNHVFLYNPGIRKVKEILDSKELGEILYLQATRTNLGPIRDQMNALWDLGTHDLSIFNHWLDACPESVSASGVSGLNPNNQDVVFATFGYPGGVLGQIHASWLNPHKVREIVVVGRKKMLVWNDLAPSPVVIYDKAIKAGDQRTDSFESHRMVVHSGQVQKPEVLSQEPLKEACRHFVSCVTQKEPCLTGVQDAYAVVQSLQAADHSLAQNGACVAIEGQPL